MAGRHYEVSMSKKRTVRKKIIKRPLELHRGCRPANLVIGAVVACLIAAGTVATRWEPLRQGIGLTPAAPAPPQQGNLGLSKEYIYAGGRLIATEEPNPQGPAPTNLVASAGSATSVSLTWTAPTGIVASYVIERRHSPTAPPLEITTGSGTPSFTDNSALIDTAYLYRVRAVFSGGGTSGYSNKDLATTVVFTDIPLAGTVVKADHLKEARRAVNAVRTLAVPELGPSSWSYPDPVSSPPEQRRIIYLEDMQELRTNLNPALSALEIPPLPDDPTLVRGLPIKSTHIQDVRDKVR